MNRETNWAALDAALCERLGLWEEWACYIDNRRYRVQSPEDRAIWEQWAARTLTESANFRIEKVAPKLSTTGDGMLVLIKALRKAGKFISSIEDVSQDESEYWSVRFDRQPNRIEKCGTLPQTLALAAAVALGIDVGQ